MEEYQNSLFFFFLIYIQLKDYSQLGRCFVSSSNVSRVPKSCALKNELRNYCVVLLIQQFTCLHLSAHKSKATNIYKYPQQSWQTKESIVVIWNLINRVRCVNMFHKYQFIIAFGKCIIYLWLKYIFNPYKYRSFQFQSL